MNLINLIRDTIDAIGTPDFMKVAAYTIDQLNPDESVTIARAMQARDCRYKFVNELESSGDLILLGCGYHASVWKDRNGDIFKMNTGKYVDAWLKYVIECNQFKGNPFLPTVHDLVAVGRGYCAKIEQLTPFGEDDYGSHCRGLFSALHKGETETLIKLLNCSQQHAQEIVTVLAFLEEDIGCGLDLGDENVMWRGTGESRQLVLNDPVAFGHFRMEDLEQMANAIWGVERPVSKQNLAA